MGVRANQNSVELREKTQHLLTGVFSTLWTPVRLLQQADPRKVIASILFGYLVLGFTVLGFNRTPLQAMITTSSAMALEFFLTWIFKKKKQFPLSAMITSFSLSILLNYSHNLYVLFIPVFFAIGSKYVFTFNGRHVLNPAQAAVSFSLIFASSLITSSPAYQWNGIAHLGLFIAGFGMFFLVPSVKRLPLVSSFLIFFTAQILFRSWLMKHHLPFETLFFGTITSPAFFLFTFFMITDPATSPSRTRDQWIVGFLLALFDLAYHLKQSYHTFFFAGLTLQLGRLTWLHGRAIMEEGNPLDYFRKSFIESGYWRRITLLGLMAGGSLGLYHKVIHPSLSLNNLNIRFEEIMPSQSGIDPKLGRVLERVDPRIQHLAKWLMSVGDSVASGDFDGDGLQDLFFTNVLKDDASRNALYRNLGDFKFERVEIPVIKERSINIEKYGLASNAMFVDVDNDQDLDLFITYAFGNPILLENQLSQGGKAEFIDVTEEKGLDLYTNSISANFFDINNDGRLDLVIGNVWPRYLPDYPADNPQKLNLFKLPEAEYEGDNRMFNFMHASWHMADNGGVNDVFLQDENGKFIKQDSKEFGLPEHFWTLAIATGDLNKDGWTDMYVANDFGPDQLYYNKQGKGFEKVEGKIFGSIGKDTYKGMNATIADIDGNGWQDVYISNVHHQLQAEGSLLWMFEEGESKNRPLIKDEATERNALNEERFGWGASVVDFNNDGLLDIAQANGMVDDTVDHKYEKCPDFWYVNEKIARSAPSVHRYVNNWGDIRGHCIYGKERNRLYLNTGNKVNTFVDVAEKIGMDRKTNSRGMAAADLNNDGRMDLVATHMFERPTIYKNHLKGENIAWIGFSLSSGDVTCNSGGIGSTITLSYRDDNGNLVKKMREAQVVNGFSAQDDLRIHFGLGGHKGPVDVEINWCQKNIVKYEGMDINQYHSLGFMRGISHVGQ